MSRLSVNLPRNALQYINLLLDLIWTMVALCDKPSNDNFQNQIEKVLYKTCLATTGVIQRISMEKNYDELDLLLKVGTVN